MTGALLYGLSDIADDYDAFIIDIFGVVHDGLKPFPDTMDTLSRMKKAGKHICLLSNSPRRVSRVIEHMASMGIPQELYEHVLTSGEATYEYLRHHATPDSLGQNCWFIGQRFREDLTELELTFFEGPEEADFILNSIPGTEDSAVLTLKDQLKTARDKNLVMICSNPDLVVNIGKHQYECAGTFAALYEKMGGQVVYHGKPHGPVYERCHALLGKPDKSRILAIGDSLHTDIAGANAFGIDSLFNLTGIHWEEVQLDHAPEEADINKIRVMVDRQPHEPNYVISGFRW